MPDAVNVSDPLLRPIALLEPQRAVTPGQAAVCYSGTRLLGGGFIAAAAKQAA